MYKGKNIKQHNLAQKKKSQQFIANRPKVQQPPPQIHNESISDSQINQILDEEIQQFRKKKEEPSQPPNLMQLLSAYSYNYNSKPVEQENVPLPEPSNFIEFSEPKKKKKKKSNSMRRKDQTIESASLQKNLKSVEQVFKPKQPLTTNYKIGDKIEWQDKKEIQDYKLLFVLRKFPKIKNFKNNQKAIIKCSLLGNDVFVCMPTGGGKSLTFQVMTFIQKGVYLCILPLVSLIFDQQLQARSVGIRAFSLTAGTQALEHRKFFQTLQNYEQGSESIVIFCTPQKLNKSPQFFKAMQRVYKNGSLVKIVIDEVHCVSTWGKQFREQYENLSNLKSFFPRTPILGLTATVTEKIKQDIINRLGIKGCFYFQSSFNRPNLYYQVLEKKKSVLGDIIKIIKKYENQSGIIYCLSKKDCEQMCQDLDKKGHKVAYYHANINEKQKRQIQTKWMKNEVRIIIATIAFGMGINKPDVRFVIHHSLSKSLENYYQESGRAGRDGEFAQCILFYGKRDKMGLLNLILKNQFSNTERKNFCMNQLSNMVKYCEDRYQCRRKFQLDYLGEKDFDPADCEKTCDNCKKKNYFKEVECIQQAKALVKLIIQIQEVGESISQGQLMQICKGLNVKSSEYKIKKISREINIQSIQAVFRSWSKGEFQQLLTYLLSYEIIQQKVVYVKVRHKGKLGVVYLKTNHRYTYRFLNEVETLILRKKTFKSPFGFNNKTEYQDEDQEEEEDQVEQSMNISSEAVNVDSEACNPTYHDYSSITEDFFEDFQ